MPPVYNCNAIPAPPPTVILPVVSDVDTVDGITPTFIPSAVITLAILPAVTNFISICAASAVFVTVVILKSMEACSAKPPASSIPMDIPTPKPFATVPDVECFKTNTSVTPLCVESSIEPTICPPEYIDFATPTPPATIKLPVVAEVDAVVGLIVVAKPVIVIDAANEPAVTVLMTNCASSASFVTSINVKSKVATSSVFVASSIPIEIPTPMPFAGVPLVSCLSTNKSLIALLTPLVTCDTN